MLVYFLPCSRPRIFLIEVSSSFLLNLSIEISLTLSILPLRGKTPHFSRPTTLRPVMALVAAESPSVRIKVHSTDLFVPAQRASSNFGRPRSVRFLAPSVFLASRASFASRMACASSRTPALTSPSVSLPP